jgi:hypothetical protein
MTDCNGNDARVMILLDFETVEPIMTYGLGELMQKYQTTQIERLLNRGPYRLIGAPGGSSLLAVDIPTILTKTSLDEMAQKLVNDVAVWMQENQ